ncbi:hypothetical protein ABZ714_33070 [Streptomyces sp. NPDC006798]|uniref:AMIN-like domain-containing (lipo)protein n=1 Tax=Streptomyces sp. NPDC006798 TaxID=3155462 RepID=UPI0033D1156F
MRRLTAIAAALVVAGGGVLGTAGVAGAATADRAAEKTGKAACSTPWGSGVKQAAQYSGTPLRNIRTGQHACYDRMVFDITGGTAKTGYYVHYVDEFRQDFTGDPIPVSGGAILSVHVNAPSYDVNMNPTYNATPKERLPGVNVTGYQTFRDHKFGVSWEGQTQVGLGVRAKLPFRVTQTDDQVIVDVAHSW